ncbi:reverse transcriptase domain-containing protein [Tanacetum coccineum]|uniref:Reverse transcriptase domain-containing protein n=1 Tax=Tanacetum coccineum TaxID=301880 RepID=A0ABQ5FUG4_9ASTR
MEVFMDDFSVFGSSFDRCLKNLEKMLKRCEETNLVLNWEKCHFMVKEGIVLGHKVFGSGIEVEAKAFPASDARNIVNFLKRLFMRFGIQKALISDRGSHFCNYHMERAMKRYGVVHRFSTAYHPQTNGQVENTNKVIKHILEKTIGNNRKEWSHKLDDALWAFRTTFKTP